MILIITLGLATVVKKWYDFPYILVWLGAFLGFYLPNLDYLIYAYVLRPENENSLQIKSLVKSKGLLRISSVAGDLKTFEKLIFHTLYFQIIFLLLTFFVLSSSSHLFGRGLVYAASLKLFLEQVWEFKKNGNITFWFREMSINPDVNQTRAYLYSIGLILLIFVLML